MVIERVSPNGNLIDYKEDIPLNVSPTNFLIFSSIGAISYLKPPQIILDVIRCANANTSNSFSNE